MRWLVAAWALAGCGNETCEPVQLAECPNCGPGEIRGGFRFSLIDESAQISASSLAVLTGCDVLYTFDRLGTSKRALDLEGDGGGVDSYALASSGEIYALRLEKRLETSFEDPRTWTEGRLAAFDDAGVEQWSLPLEGTWGSYYVKAAPEGPYLVHTKMRPQHWEPEAISYYETAGELTSYTTDGMARWSRPVDGFEPDGRGGIFVFENGADRDALSVQGKISLLDPSGIETWTRDVVVNNGNGARVTRLEITSAAVSASGELMIAGKFTGSMVDFGDYQITGTTHYNSFAAALSASGATRFAHAISYERSIGRLSVAPLGDELALGGLYSGDAGTLALPYVDDTWNGFIAVFGPEGLDRVHVVSGDGAAGPWGLVPGDDGTLWATIVTRSAEDDQVELKLGSTSFKSDGSEPGRDYLVNLVP